MSVGVRASGVWKTYRDAAREVKVLCGLDLQIQPGERLAVVGASGSGKSTLLHVLGGLDRPDGGEIEVGGQRLDRMAPDALAAFRNRTVGFVFQFHQLLADFTALENVLLPGRIAGRPLAELVPAGRSLLAEVGLAERTSHYPSQLSGGEQQRVALCRALALEPALLLADEPTGSLDAESGELVLDLLEQLQRRRGTTSVVVTHNPALAGRCDRILRLHGGVLSA